MAHETIRRIEENIRSSETLSREKKEELLKLVGELKGEVATLSQTHQEDARSIAGFAESSIHEAMGGEKDDEHLRHSVEELNLSVRQFEVSHPKLVGLINAIGQSLWKIGI